MVNVIEGTQADDGTVASDVLADLRGVVPSLPDKLSIAGRYALDYPDRVAFDSMRSTARACGVAAPTMLRLARVLGYENYGSFRDEFRNAILRAGFVERAAALQRSDGDVRQQELSRSITAAALANLRQTHATLDLADVSRFVASVRAARRMFVLGTSSMYWLAGLMETTGGLALPNLRADHSHGASSTEMLASIDDDDAAIALAAYPYAERTVSALRHAAAEGATTFALTDRPSSPLAEIADVTFYAATDSPHYYPSLISFTLALEILLASAVADATPLDRLSSAERLRRESGAYRY